MTNEQQNTEFMTAKYRTIFIKLKLCLNSIYVFLNSVY